jgi:hypothetical protein
MNKKRRDAPPFLPTGMQVGNVALAHPVRRAEAMSHESQGYLTHSEKLSVFLSLPSS